LVEVSEGAEEIFGDPVCEKNVFLELPSCLFTAAACCSRGCVVGEVKTGDLGFADPKGKTRDGNGHPELLKFKTSFFLFVTDVVGTHFGVTLDSAGDDCLGDCAEEGEEEEEEEGVEEKVKEGEPDDETLLRGFESEDIIEEDVDAPLWKDFEEGEDKEVEEEMLLWEESEELNSSSSTTSPSSPLGYMLPFRALSNEKVSRSRLSSRGLDGWRRPKRLPRPAARLSLRSQGGSRGASGPSESLLSCS